jgi:hypothetical protein
MAILDMQGMDLDKGHGGGHGGSHLSLLLCDSAASVTVCL